MITYRIKNKNSGLKSVPFQEGESIEMKIVRRLQNGEAIGAETEPIYTDKKDGVIPGYNIRTDRWETAVAATGVLEKTKAAKAEYQAKEAEGEGGETVEPQGA